MTDPEITLLRLLAQDMAKAQNPAPQDVLDLVKRLKNADEFDTARRMLDQVRPRMQVALAVEQRVELAQAHSLCTYKDVNLPAEKRASLALTILESIGLRSPDCKNKETLRQGGAIYKYLWESSGQPEHLHTALAFYLAGWQRDPQNDLGWCGVHAAYLLDLLAFRDRTQARGNRVRPGQAKRWALRARNLRRELLESLPSLRNERAKPEDRYWFEATLAEVHFGLRQYDQAAGQLERAMAFKPADWMQKTTAFQFVDLARLQQVKPPLPAELNPQNWHAAWRVIVILLGPDTLTVVLASRGKVGLALSGGGFRAALFHLGVLARLAECNVLRSVETLSTVSGGSIVGAHYYLALRHLLESTPDALIRRADYVELVRQLIKESMLGVEKNLRVRALSNLWSNLKMIFSSAYSRSMRMGELYERYLFDQVKDTHDSQDMRRLCRLPIVPATTDDGTDSAFKPRNGNWKRYAKVPNLMLNTTSLNSGHNWHFTARWMGEPPGLVGDEIDMNERYRRVYYADAPTDPLKHYPLAYAVAASSCVPAMFEPLPLSGLYPGRTIRLVDGGVHDNQGMAALLNDGCNFILCSDASGQMASQDNPANGLLGVFWRADSILQDRLREAQYSDIKARADNRALKGLFFVHLKQDLESAPIDWIGSKDPQDETCGTTCTPYKVDRELQRLLSEIRTDLDSFTEVESYALMASGYLMTDRQLRDLDRDHKASGLPGTWGDFDIGAPMWRTSSGEEYWPFAPLVPILGKSPESADRRRRDLKVQLQAGSAMFGRVWQLVGGLRKTFMVLRVLAVLAASIWIWEHRADPMQWGGTSSVGSLVLAVGLPLAALYVPLMKFLDPQKAARSWLMGLGVAVFGSLASNLHLAVFEPLLRRRGRLRRLLRLPVGD